MAVTADLRRSPGALAVTGGVFVLLVAYSTNVHAAFWSPRAALLLPLGAVGLVLPGSAALRFRADPAAAAALVFVAWAGVATVASGNRTMAFYGRYNWGTGWLFVAVLAGWWACGRALRPQTGAMVETAVIWG